jgi:hypothetical protein
MARGAKPTASYYPPESATRALWKKAQGPFQGG